MACECVESLEKRQIVTDMASATAGHFVDAFGDMCPEMLNFAAEQIMVRLVHIMACVEHRDLGHDHEKVYDEVAKIFHRMQKQSPALLSVIIKEGEAMENGNARH